MARRSESSHPVALANEAPCVQSPPRAKRLCPINAPSYERAKVVVSHIVKMAIAEHASQREVARAAGVTHRLVQAWCDPHGANGLRLDVALALAEEGGPSCRNVVIQSLREVLAIAEQGLEQKK